MATLLFSTLGTLVGGPLGGFIGALAGQQVDKALIGGGSREGPRLKDLSITTSSYGSVIPRHYGTMRVSGTVIWATDLIERSEKQGGGKGQPSVTAYNYSASFAVALSSRPISAIGRIWADGNLLRGAAGDLKTGGTFRLHQGHADQQPDPLIAAAEGSERCPAWRGTAYAVFEDLDLSTFGNRIPALTFEVIADETSLSLDLIMDGLIEDVDAEVDLADIRGFSCEGPVIESLQMLAPFHPIDCDACGERITIAPERGRSAPVVLGNAAISAGDGDFGTLAGHARRRLPPTASPPGAIRYYDVARDFQPGLQRVPARLAAGQPTVLELPAALSADEAQALIAAAARRAAWADEILSWRTVELDPAVAPGAVVRAPGQPGLWRVMEWEWRESGIELQLERLAAVQHATAAGDPGQTVPPPDNPSGPTTLVAFEAPWNGTGQDSVTILAATSSAAAGWTGAALYADNGDGALAPLGPSGRQRAVMGTAVTALGKASPAMLDRTGSVMVELLSPTMTLTDATPEDLARGANQALLGEEYLQFGRATPTGGGRWLLSHLLRGRGGSEKAILGHVPGEPFVLLDGTATPLDTTVVGAGPQTRIAALGRGDAEAVRATIACRGIALRPLSPVHPSYATSDAGLALGWTRRARGAWTWLDHVETPMHEQAESYEVTFGPIAAPVARWQTDTPALTIDNATLSGLRTTLPGGPFHVRQRGSYALSDPLFICDLPET